MATILLVGALDTKGLEYDYVRQRILDNGCDVVLIDTGILGEPLTEPNITRAEVARAANANISDLVAQQDRGIATATMTLGATTLVSQLYASGSVHGILGLGGSGGTGLITRVMQALPIGLPKLVVSTVASGNTRPYVGTVDITLMYSVVDIAGLNRVTEPVLSNAAAAIAGMAHARAAFQPSFGTKPLVTATMFGVTTPCVTAAKERLEARGYEIVVFHATGVGGQSMESLIRTGEVAGVLDVTTTEVADELVGGVMSAGPHRLEAASTQGIPQVVSLGALHVVNFGERNTVPERFRGRNLYAPNDAITLMRTTPEECTTLGHIIAAKLNRATGPVAVFLPLQGFATSATPGGHFYDPDADKALIETLKANLKEDIEVYELDMDINDRRFGHAMADRLHELLEPVRGQKQRQA